MISWVNRVLSEWGSETAAMLNNSSLGYRNQTNEHRMMTDGGIRGGEPSSINPSHTLRHNALVADRVIKRLPPEYQKICTVHYVDGKRVGGKSYHYKRLNLMHHRFEQAWTILQGD